MDRSSRDKEMVGGEVIGVSEWGKRPGQVRVLTSEWIHRKGRDSYRDDRNACYVWVEKPEGARQIQVGDWLWWQGELAMWTPKEVRERDSDDDRCGVDWDIRLRRHGYSVGANL